MNLDTIIKLLDAGYTKEDIQSMQEPEQEQVSEQEPEQEPESTSAHESKNDLNVEVFNKLNKELENLNSKIKELDTSIKKGNILGSQLNLPKEQTAEDVLASIITPKIKNKED